MSTDDALIEGVGIGGFRSLPTLRYFGPLKKVSLLAGQNNVGKSNVIRFLDRYLGETGPERVWADTPRGGGEPLRLALGYRIDLTDYTDWLNQPRLVQRMERFLALQPLHPTGDADVHWIRYILDPKARGRNGKIRWEIDPGLIDELVTAAAQAPPQDQVNLQLLRHGLSSGTVGTVASNVISVLGKFFPLADLPRVEVIHAFRRVTPDNDRTDHSGGNLIQTLAEHQNPNAQNRALRFKFDAINSFVKQVLEDPRVEIEIPFERDHILVHQDGHVFPLEDLGTGIHQVIILSAAATLLERSLVCIEEPEVNLHPVLQRKLVRYLSENTTNQYLIATHSAHMLDYERASVIHIRKDASGSVPSPATATQQVADVCADLGYRPSDILQANAVIWVEGPSDRAYLRHWIHLVQPDFPFIEGIHYSIMFYGGRLLSHLTGDDPDQNSEVQEFISLRTLNRESAILIDSDKKKSRDSVNATKLRVIREFDAENLPGHAWMTNCRTIENYVPTALLKQSIEAVHPRAEYRPPTDKWGDPMVAHQGGSTDKRFPLDKVRVAAAVVGDWTDPNDMVPDLKKEVRRIIKFIEEANR